MTTCSFIRAQNTRSSNMTTTEILELSKKAVSKLAEGSYSESAALLRTGISLLNTSANSDDMEHPHADDQFGLVCVPCNAFRDGNVSVGTGNAFELYDFAFCIESDVQDGMLNDAMARDEVTVTMLYNFALSYHGFALLNANGRKENLCKALRFYELTLQMTKKLAGPGNHLMTMATFNNMCSIHDHFFDSASLVKCIGALNQCIEEAGRYGFDLSSIDTFTLNVATFFAGRPAAAA